jgi:hypothetical protein
LFIQKKIEKMRLLYYHSRKPIAAMSKNANKTSIHPRGRATHNQKDKWKSLQTPRHHPDVLRYRTNVTDKCLKEVAAAEGRTSQKVTIGSPEYMGIAPACDRSCGTKYHWCPTCFLAPRCDCMMPHFSSIGQPPNQVWYLDQVAAVKRFDYLPCDNRYWTMTTAIREIAFSRQSTFCDRCTDAIQSVSDLIRRAHGRTYLELAHYLWAIIGDDICTGCINMINSMECEHSKSKCPSAGASLINARLTNYQSRKYGEHAAQNPESCQTPQSHNPWWYSYPNGITGLYNDQKSGAIDWNNSPKPTSDPSGSPRESFSIISDVVEAALYENTPMLLASQLMDMWFPESEDDAPVGSAVPGI